MQEKVTFSFSNFGPLCALFIIYIRKCITEAGDKMIFGNCIFYVQCQDIISSNFPKFPPHRSPVGETRLKKQLSSLSWDSLLFLIAQRAAFACGTIWPRFDPTSLGKYQCKSLSCSREMYHYEIKLKAILADTKHTQKSSHLRFQNRNQNYFQAQLVRSRHRNV